MADTRRTRDEIIGLFPNNTTRDVSAQDLRDFVVSAMALFGPVIAIAGTTVAAINRRYRCADAAANYNVTLPPVSGNDEQMVGINIDRGNTKLVTLVGNGAELIEGLNNRIMHAGEAATLQVQNGEWKKIAGKTIPMVAAFDRATNQVLTSSVWAKILLTAASPLGCPHLWDAANNRAKFVRPNLVHVSFSVILTDVVTLGLVSACKNGIALNVGQPLNGAAQSASVWASASGDYSVVAGDHINLIAYAGGTAPTAGSGTVLMSVTELPQW